MLISTISSANADLPQVAQAPDGTAVAVWEQWDGFGYNIWANRDVPGEGWGASTLIETDNAGDALTPRVALDGAGNAVVVWSQTDGLRFNIRAARFAVGSGWNAPTLIEGSDAGDATSPDLTVNEAGDAVAVWSQLDGFRLGIWSNTYRAGGGWSTASLLDNGSTEDALSPRVALNGADEAVAAWSQSNGSHWSVGASYSRALGNWSPISVLGAPPNGNASQPCVAIFPNGTAVVAWNETGPSAARLAASTYVPEGGWTAAVALDSDGFLGAANVDLAASASGLAFAAWSQPGLPGWTVLASSFDPSYGWSLPRAIATSASVGAGAVSVSADEHGNAIAAWSQSNGSQWSVWKSQFSPGLGWSVGSPLDPDSTGNAYRAEVSTSGDGRYTAVWDKHNGVAYGTGNYILSASYDAPPLVVSTPIAGQVLSATAVTVEGTASPGSAVAVNGFLLGTRLDGSFSVHVGLGSGASEVTIASWDASGNAVGIYLPLQIVDPVADLALQLAFSEGRLLDLQRQLDLLQGQQYDSAAALANLTAQLTMAFARLDSLAAAGNLSSAGLQSLQENLSAASSQLDLLDAEQEFNASRLKATALIMTNLSWNLSRLIDRTAGLEGVSESRAQDRDNLTALVNGTAANVSTLDAELGNAQAQAAAAQARAGRAESAAAGAEAVAVLVVAVAAGTFAASARRWSRRGEP